MKFSQKTKHENFRWKPRLNKMLGEIKNEILGGNPKFQIEIKNLKKTTKTLWRKPKKK